MTCSSFNIFHFLLLLGSLVCSQAQNFDLAAERTRAIAHLFSYIQCFPPKISDGPSQKLFQVHQNFKPRNHLQEYKNRTAAKILFDLVDQLKNDGTPNDLPFTNVPADIGRMNIILQVLYHNTDNWSLFYDTATWLLHRVNLVQLWYAVKITCLEKFSNLVTTPSAVETFPQLFVPKKFVLSSALTETRQPFPLQYWTSDPNLHDFHVQWHMDNPFWWDDKVWGVTRHRKGELFLYLHHQIICRYQAEWASSGMSGNLEPLGIQDDDRIPEGYTPDVINVNFADFFSRENGKRIGEFGPSLGILRTYYNRLMEGIGKGFFLGPGKRVTSLKGIDAIDIVAATTEASRSSVNSSFYGSFHNFLHRQLAGLDKPQEFPIPGIQAHPETAMRDPVFYRLHARVDLIYMKYKSTTKPYTQNDLDFPGISVRSVTIRRSTSSYITDAGGNTDAEVISNSSPVLTTYFRTVNYDISTAVRPCRAVNDKPVTVPIQILDHDPFSYQITIVSTRPRTAYGMVRIFLWPEYSQNGAILQGEGAHRAAIELDRFRVRLDPNGDTVITRSSLNSSLTHQEPSPGIKQLYNVKKNSPLITDSNIRRSCGFPNNLLIPRGTKRGMEFKLIVYVSDETDMGDNGQGDYPNFPLCGALNGQAYPDSRSMGFPFDRPGTRFSVRGGGTIKNVRDMRIVIKHHE